jgi:hypothetical protein
MPPTTAIATHKYLDLPNALVNAAYMVLTIFMALLLFCTV